MQVQELKTTISIIGIKEIQSLYGFSRDETYELLKNKNCPVLPRSRNKPYKVVQDEFEKWLRSCRG
ncbi:MAG: hypothetical protein RSA49_00220 [Anaerovoracaceae bacterium]